MLESMPIAVAVGTVLGLLAGLGVGGGSLLILWLTTLLHWDQPDARAVNLLFFLPSAAIACFFHRKQGRVPWKRILPGILAGCASALLFSLLGTGFDTGFLKKAFGILLLFTGIREILYKPKPKTQ